MSEKNSLHLVCSMCHLLLGDVQLVQQFNVGTNDVCWMGIFTALLMSIELFLRKIKCKLLTSENFNTKMFVACGDFNIEALNIEVREKRKCRKAPNLMPVLLVGGINACGVRMKPLIWI